MIQMEESTKNPIDENNNEKEESRKDYLFYYAIAGIFLILLFIILVPRLFTSHSLTIVELHERNLQGKLPADNGYMYNGHSFVFYGGLWYTQVATSTGARIFNIPFHYSPKDVEDINIIGELNYSNLDKYKNFFMTFDPKDENLGHIAVAIGEADQTIINVFGKGVIGACTKNSSEACKNTLGGENEVCVRDVDKACIGRPIVQCNNTNAPVFYFSQSNGTKLVYKNNCIILSGLKEDLFKVTDKMLFNFLKIAK
jgi:hypothetical protein